MLNNKLIAFLKLIRIENLIIIALTHYLMRYYVLQKILHLHSLDLELNSYLFFLLAVSTILIAAAGYIINDYFDVKTDLINHPDTVVIDKVIKRRWAIILHIAFTGVGILLGIFVALKTGYLRLAIFHFVAAIVLWFYSTHFKKQLLVGNIVVSILSAAVVFLPFVFEMGVMQKVHYDFNDNYLELIISALKITVIFSLFAFITSLAREIIKDMEDFIGDKATGCQTLPIKWGMTTGKVTVFFLLCITLILLLVTIYNSIKAQRIIFTPSNVYVFFALILPIVMLILLVVKANTPKHYKQSSLLLKFVMLTGLLYAVIF